MKKLLTIITTITLLGILPTMALAAEKPLLNTTTETKMTVESKAEREAFKAQVQPLRATLKANREQNQVLREKNRALLEEIKAKLADLKASETKLSEETKTAIKSIRQELKALRVALASTKGAVKNILTANKVNLKNMDYSATEAAFNEAYNIQKLRFEKLTQINNKLTELLANL